MHTQNHRHAHLCAHVTCSEIRVVQLRGLNETYASTSASECLFPSSRRSSASLCSLSICPHIQTRAYTQPITVCMSTTTTCHALAQEMPIFSVWLESMHPNRLQVPYPAPEVNGLCTPSSANLFCRSSRSQPLANSSVKFSIFIKPLTLATRTCQTRSRVRG